MSRESAAREGAHTRTYAPLSGRIVAASLAAILLLAAAVCALHFVNAVSLRGTASRSDYAAPADDVIAALVERIEEKDGVLTVGGALLRGNTGVVRLRVALIGEDGETLTLLNTQMVRRYDLARACGVDDHCGFAASAWAKSLAPGRYAVALADESDGTKRLVSTGASLELGEGGVLLGWTAEEAWHDEAAE